MRAIDLALNLALPEDLRTDDHDLSKAGIEALMQTVAEAYPERYAAVSKAIGDLGRNAAYVQGNTIRSADLKPVIPTQEVLKEMDAEVAALEAQGITGKEYEDARNDIWFKYSEALDQATMDAALENHNSIARSVASGARGKSGHLKALVSTPGLFMDNKGDPVPLFVRNSYGQGLRPAEILAGAYGARTSVTDAKAAVAKGGDWGKLLVQAGANITVTEHDCGTTNGLDIDPTEPGIRGRVLARGAGGLEEGAVLDRKGIAALRKTDKKAVLRSPMTCTTTNGVCAKCMGKNAGGEFPTLGTSVGIEAGHALSEPVVQGSLNTKRLGGAASGQKSFSGLDYITQFTQVPGDFKDKAVVAPADGTITEITEAPQGGTYIKIDGEQHYVAQGFEPKVEVAQRVEAGDILTEGLANPREITESRGLGRGRRYWADRLGQILRDSGNQADALNLETVSKGVMDHVKVPDPTLLEGLDVLPDSLVSMNRAVQHWKPKTQVVPPSQAAGRYLTQPVLHYTPGTRVTPNMLKRMSSVDWGDIEVTDEEPPFLPHMERLRTASHANDDWLASMHTSYLKGQLTEAAIAGDDTDTGSNTHFAPRLAVGKDFGTTVRHTGNF